MPSKRKYNVKGTNDLLVLAAIFFFLGIWAIKDAWFPSDKVLKKHPSEIVASFSTAGSVEKVFVRAGDSIGEKQVLAKLRTDKVNLDYEAAKAAYTESKKQFAILNQDFKKAAENGISSEGIATFEEQLKVAKAAQEESLAKVTELRAVIDASELLAESKGAIKEIKIETHSMVKADEAVMIIDPKDHFYLFNKSLAIFSFFAFWVFLAIHILAR